MSGPFEVPHGHRRGTCCGMGHTPASLDPGGKGQFRHYRRPEGCCGCAIPAMILAAGSIACLAAILL